MRGFAQPLRLSASMLQGTERLQRLSRVFRAGESVARFVEAFTLFTPEEIRRLRGRSVDAGLLEASIEPILRGTEHLDSLGRFLFLDSRFSLADDLLLYGDKIAMAASLEVRVPFLDLELLRFVERIPASLRVTFLRPKQLLRMALKNVLPRTILNRPKRNFSPPDTTWMERCDNGPGLHWLLESGAATSLYFRMDEIAQLTQEQQLGKRDRRRQLFALLAFELWNRAFFPGALKVQGAPRAESACPGSYSPTRPGRI
jgi:asparagine synthase (glutamine-hydrolysing)